MSGLDDLTDKQREFVDEIGKLLAGYASNVGPSFDGEPGSVPVTSPVVAGWVMTVQWTDLDDGQGYTVHMDSGMDYATRVGLLMISLDSARDEAR